MDTESFLYGYRHFCLFGNITALLCLGGGLWLLAVIEVMLISLSQDGMAEPEDGKSRSGAWMLQCLQHPDRIWRVLKITGILLQLSFIFLFIQLMQALVGEYAALWISFPPVLFCLYLIRMLSRLPSPERALRWASVVFPVWEKLFFPILWPASLLYHRRRQPKNILEKVSETVLENENILKGIVKFGNIDTHTIMKPRMDVETVGISVAFPDLVRFINECGYSRLPVLDERDQVKGVLYVKDLLPYMHESAGFQWQSLIREAYFVPGNKKIDDLLKEFQAKKIHMAVVVDEYGSMVGIITLEDILEEIVGDIADESDEDESDYQQTDVNTYLFDGKVLLNDFYRIIRVADSVFDEIRGEADTLAGLILELKGEIPQKGDSVDYGNFSFHVEEMENRRIKQIKVTVNA
ncbi:MAG: CBS domain-containing protein [Bacteroidales bacterium]|nr:CBS domain-containing protein [Bacteroidales bacterium]